MEFNGKQSLSIGHDLLQSFKICLFSASAAEQASQVIMFTVSSNKIVAWQYPFHKRETAGFTLIEMLVSLALLGLILVVLTQTTAAMRAAVSQTTSAIQEFQAAGDAFEVMTRRISQATLNGHDDTAANTSLTVTGYARASELRFISGPASISQTALNNVSGPLFSSTSPYHPTHAIFFQAPLGKFSSTATAAASLVEMMNTCGYYIEWNEDTSGGLGMVPAFLPTTWTPRWRFRLMELIEPSDALTIYKDTSGSNLATNPASKSWTYTSRDWFQTPYSNKYYHAIADNVILLAFLPMVSPQGASNPVGGAPDGTSTDLMTNPSTSSSGYIYDTAPIQSGTPPVSQNLLPPMVYVLMIAVDEKSFTTYQLSRGNSSAVPTNLGIDSSSSSSFLTSSNYTNRQSDIATVTNALQAAHIKYRIYSTIVPLTAH